MLLLLLAMAGGAVVDYNTPTHIGSVGNADTFRPPALAFGKRDNYAARSFNFSPPRGSDVGRDL